MNCMQFNETDQQVKLEFKDVSYFSSGEGGTTDHSKLINRDVADQHPMSAITGLEDALSGKQPTGNYLTEEQDPTVPEWAKQPQKPAYTAQEVGALPDTTHIPTALSELSEDATHRVVTDAEKAVWNAKSNFSGSYNDLTDKPTIPGAYTLPIASSTQLGGVQPVAKTDAMTQSVGVDAAGALFTVPGSGGGSAGSEGYETIVDFTAEEAVTVFQTDAITDTAIINKIKNASILMISIYVPNNSQDAESTSNGTVDIAFYNGSWSSDAWTGLSVIPNPTQTWCKYGSKDILICIPGKTIHQGAYAYAAAWGAFYNSGVPAPEVKTITFPKDATKSGAYFKVTGSQPMAKGTRFRVGVLV